jgi:hypothetical protein
MAQLAFYVMGIGASVAVVVYSLRTNEPRLIRLLGCLCGLGVGLLTLLMGHVRKDLHLAGAALIVLLSLVTGALSRSARQHRQAGQ